MGCSRHLGLASKRRTVERVRLATVGGVDARSSMKLAAVLGAWSCSIRLGDSFVHDPLRNRLLREHEACFCRTEIGASDPLQVVAGELSLQG